MNKRAMILGLTLCLSAAIYICPAFTQSFHTLTLQNSGVGAGIVKTIDSSIECENNCTVFLDSGSSLILSAKPEDGSKFVGWTGNCYLVDEENRCHVEINDEIKITAFFDIVPIKKPINELAKDAVSSVLIMMKHMSAI